MEVGGDGAAGGEVEDEVEAAVDAASQERGHVGVADVAHRAQLRQEVLLLLLVRRGRRRQALHGDGAAVVQHPAVDLSVPALAHHVVCGSAAMPVAKAKLSGREQQKIRQTVAGDGFTLVEAIGGLVELLVREAPPGGLVRRRVDVDALLGALVGVAPAAEGQEPLQAPAPEVIHLPLRSTEQWQYPPRGRRRKGRPEELAQRSNPVNQFNPLPLLLSTPCCLRDETTHAEASGRIETGVREHVRVRVMTRGG